MLQTQDGAGEGVLDGQKHRVVQIRPRTGEALVRLDTERVDRRARHLPGHRVAHALKDEPRARGRARLDVHGQLHHARGHGARLAQQLAVVDDLAHAPASHDAAQLLARAYACT